jgi:hypothetical protein
MNDVNSRRLFVQTCVSGALLLVGISCETKEKKKAATSAKPCLDYSDLSEEDIKKRKSLGFVEKAPAESKHCANCNLYLPAQQGEECGRCQLFKGPVPPEAYCTYWAPQV